MGLFRRPNTQAAVDPELRRQETAARNERLTAIRDRVSSDTEGLIRTYGARMSLLGRRPTPGVFYGRR